MKSSNAPNRGVESGDSFTYTITVTNTGTGTAQDVVVTDTVPVGLTIEDVDGPGCSSSGRNVTCNVGDLAAGASATITITVTATDEACPEVRNRANAGWTDPDGTPGSEGSNAVDTDVVCVGGETVTPTPDPPQPTTVTPPGGTAFTGANDAVMRLGALAVALLVIGSGLTFAGYRRRTREDDAS